MASLIAAEIDKAGPIGHFPGGIVLTGGGSLLRGFAEVTQQVTDLPARIAAPQGISGMNTEIRGPHHSTVVGLLLWGTRVNLRGRGVRSHGHNGSGSALVGAGGRVGSVTKLGSAGLGRWLRELF